MFVIATVFIFFRRLFYFLWKSFDIMCFYSFAPNIPVCSGMYISARQLLWNITLRLLTITTTSETSSTKQNTKKKTLAFSLSDGPMQSKYLYLRSFYINAVARVFHLNNLKKLGRISECMLLFQKVKKKHMSKFRV